MATPKSTKGADSRTTRQKPRRQKKTRKNARESAERSELRRLGNMLELRPNGIDIKRVRIVGNGPEASADLYLSDGTVIYVDKLGRLTNAANTKALIASYTGINPGTLKQADCVEAIAIMRTVGDVQRTATEDDIARDWGTSFLQESKPWSGLDMNDQAERWSWFKKLDDTDPLLNARAQGGRNVARLVDVLEDATSGERYVKCGWFQMYVRQQAASISPQELGPRMERVGWKRRGSRGQVKATEPGFSRSLAHRFYVVEKGWEEG
jgi:hypothetical protein